MSIPSITSRTAVTAVLAAAVVLGLASPSALACPIPPPPVRDLATERYYSDEAGSEIDPALLAEQRAQTAPIRDFLARVTQDADARHRQKSPSLGLHRAKCALDWLATWAQGNALLGELPGKQAEAERRWTLAGAALAYLKVKPHASVEERAAIEGWLLRLAVKAQQAFEDPGTKRNNHWYWLGLGLGGTALATGEETLWKKARGILNDAGRDIGADGTLQLEMTRKARALHYHAFALMPIVSLIDLAVSKGEPPSAQQWAAFDRLVRITIDGVIDPANFDTIAGVEQERPVKAGAGWLPLYQTLRQHADPAFAFDSGDIEIPSGHRWLGGNVFILHSVLTTALTKPRT